MGNTPCSGYAIALLVFSVLAVLPGLAGSYVNLTSLLVLAGAIWATVAGANRNFASASAGSWFAFAFALIGLIVIVTVLSIGISYVDKLGDDVRVDTLAVVQKPLSMPSALVTTSADGDNRQSVKNVLIAILVISIIFGLIMLGLSAGAATCFARAR